MVIELCPPGWVLPVYGSPISTSDPRGSTTSSRTRATVWLCPYAKRRARTQNTIRVSNFAKRFGGSDAPKSARLGLKVRLELYRRPSLKRINANGPQWTMADYVEGENKKGDDEADEDIDNQKNSSHDKGDREDREAMEGMVGDTEAGENVGNEGADWDTSWNELKKARSGGVFSFPPDDPSGNQTESELERIDRRTEQLTSLWTNENGYLIGILVLFGILAFYIYVYQTGGIRH